jgi:hypothetical protein
MQAAIDEDSVETNEILILKDFKIAIRLINIEKNNILNPLP